MNSESGLDLNTDLYIDRMSKGQANILVAVRTRPQVTNDYGTPLLRIVEGKMVVLLDPNTDKYIPE
jgi:kinesin family protein 18/19